MNEIKKLQLKFSRLLSFHPTRTFYICSYGGSGSKMIRGFLRDFGDTYHPHSKQPPTILTRPEKRANVGEVNFVTGGKTINTQHVKVLYIFRNPVNALKSRYSIEHCQNVEGQWETLPETLDAYAQRAEDLFGLDAHFDAWTKPPQETRNYKICCMRYETLWDHLDDMLDYLEIPRHYKERIPAQRETKRIIADETEEALTRMYQPLIDKISASPKFSIV